MVEFFGFADSVLPGALCSVFPHLLDGWRCTGRDIGGKGVTIVQLKSLEPF